MGLNDSCASLTLAEDSEESSLDSYRDLVDADQSNSLETETSTEPAHPGSLKASIRYKKLQRDLQDAALVCGRILSSIHYDPLSSVTASLDAEGNKHFRRCKSDI